MSGPVPKPSKNVVTPRVATVLEQFKSCAMAEMAAVCMDEQKAIVAVMNTTIIVQVHLRAGEKFKGFSSCSNVMDSGAV